MAGRAHAQQHFAISMGLVLSSESCRGVRLSAACHTAAHTGSTDPPSTGSLRRGQMISFAVSKFMAAARTAALGVLHGSVALGWHHLRAGNGAHRAALAAATQRLSCPRPLLGRGCC